MQHHAVLLLQSTLDIPKALQLYGDASAYEVCLFPFQNLGITEIRQLIFEASLRPQSGTHRLLVVVITTITFEAQQALLKILEEPPSTTLFLFIASHELQLLPTVRSRFNLIENNAEETAVPLVFSIFLASSVAERLELISKRLEKKDLSWVEQLKVGLKDQVAKEPQSLLMVLPTISLVLNYLNTRGASNKMLLEELALSLPVRA